MCEDCDVSSVSKTANIMPFFFFFLPELYLVTSTLLVSETVPFLYGGVLHWGALVEDRHPQFD